MIYRHTKKGVQALPDLRASCLVICISETTEIIQERVKKNEGWQ
jgi:hypothetical protein